MTDYTTLTVRGLDLNYVNTQEVKGISAVRTSTLCFFTLILAVSALILWLYVSNNTVLEELSRYVRIKNTVRGWKPLVNAKSNLESDRGRQISADRPELFKFQCVDFGTYFLPVRLNKDNYLPEAIQRGTGDGWVIQKAAKVDLSAQQFCQYVIQKYSQNTITCGNEMMKKIGYSGFFEGDHWCALYHNLLT
ncbi:entry/fusion imv membrane protein [Pteropox virus]|uniref:Entry/fusion imv membrane protein n=1 Tax=Pteropox virus TaxID=1873698 RepID=A0A1B1MRL2_9POXV|nr:entry/fusion imv membrane protein [Pteropox virus]ANS71160.1 entry/fusion imv membrane protein [Pteropox virus]